MLRNYSECTPLAIYLEISVYEINHFMQYKFGSKVITSLFMLTSLNMSAQSTEADTIVNNIELHEVTVEAPEILRRADRDVYLPNSASIKASRTGVQLISALQIPSLIVDPTTNSISRLGGGNVEIRINGRRASAQEVAALLPTEIIRIEYIANPSLKYGDVAAVVDVYVKRRNSGYSIMLNALQSPNRGWGNYDFTAKAHQGRGETMISYNGNPMWNMDCYRLNDETITRADGTQINRHEEGIPTKNDIQQHNGTLQYSYAVDKKFLFSAQSRVKYTSNDNLIRGIITDNVSNTPSEELDSSPLSTTQADIDLYFHYALPRRQTIYFNVVGSLVDAESSRTFIDKTADINIHNSIDSRDYRVVAEGIYEKKYYRGVLTTGVRNESLWSKAYYYDMTKSTSRTRDNRLYGFAEWQHNFERFSYSIGLGATLYSITEPTASTYATLSPRATIRYRANDWLTLRFQADGRTISPTLTQISPIAQAIDQYQYQIGNPELKPYTIYSGKLSAETFYKGYNGNISIEYSGAPDPIMTAKTFVGDQINISYYNAGSHQEWALKGSLRAPIIKNLLNISVEGGWHHITSRGLNYSHSYHQPFINAQMMVMYRNWWFMTKCNSTFNTLHGELISSTNYNLNIFGIGYNFRNATLMVGITNPFIDSMKMPSRDLSAIAGNNREYHAASTQNLVWIGVTINLHKGRKYRADKRNIENNFDYETIKTTSK